MLYLRQLTKPQAVSHTTLASMPKYTEKQLQEAIRHARREPDVPTRYIAELYGVTRTTLRQRVLGKHQDSRAAHRDEQLFSTGEETAIAEYASIMADAGFPLSHDLLRQIAQGIINEREMPQHGQVYIRYQERARAAATNDIELQADFLRKLANLV